MKLIQCVALILIAAPVATYAVVPDAPGKGGASSPLTVTDSTQIPGKVLKKGVYTIRILDHLSDRMIVQVDHNGKMLSTFLAVPSSAQMKSGSQGSITLNTGVGAKQAIRAFAFPDGTIAEFVYPKLEAVGLAKANDTTIPAIDPASEGLKGNPALSPTDREMVALWMLTPTPVGPNDTEKGIQAKRYQPEVASVATPPSRIAPAHNELQQIPPEAGSPLRVASVAAVPAKPKARPAMDALPHTASTMPLVMLGAFISLAGAAGLRRRRISPVTV